jgi:hypothetical protein
MIQVEAFWVMAPRSVVVGYERFTGPCCLHLQGEDPEELDLKNTATFLAANGTRLSCWFDYTGRSKHKEHNTTQHE